MKSVLITLFSLILTLAIRAQEFVPTTLNLNSSPVSSCLACDGSCTVVMPDLQEYTYRWNDEDGNVLQLETNTLGQSTLDNLCLGSYQLIVSGGEGVVEETYFSILEPGVNLGSSGTIYSCADFESLDLNEFILSESTPNAYWSSLNNPLVPLGVLADAQIENAYKVTFNNQGCLNQALVPVIINDSANPGDGTVYIICENFDEFDLIQPMAGDPDLGGVWLNENDEVVSSIFNPELDESEVFTYLIDSVQGCNDAFASLEIIKNVLPYAGEDSQAPVCTLDGQVLNLNDYLDPNADFGGEWYDNQNQPVGNLVNSQDIIEGLYRYTVTGSVPCPADISYVDVVFVDELNAGENIELEVCSTEEAFSLNEVLSAQADDSGEWFDSEGNAVQNTFDPAQDPSQTFEYRVFGLGCEQDISSVTITREEFVSAGLDSVYTFCEDGEVQDLDSYLSVLPSPLGTWYKNNLPLNTSFEIPNIGLNNYEYRIAHTICPAEVAEVTITVDDNPNYPILDDLTVCDQETQIDLNQLSNLVNPVWTVSWENDEGEVVDAVQNVDLSIEGTYQIQVISNNSCPNLYTLVDLSLESTSFSSSVVEDDLCSTTEQVNLNDYLTENDLDVTTLAYSYNGIELGSSMINLTPGNFSYSIQELGLNACQSATIQVNLNVDEFIEAGEDIELIYCQSTDESLNLSDYVTEDGVWTNQDNDEISNEIDLLPVNSGSYIFTVENSPVCEASSLVLDLSISEALTYSPIEDITTCLGEVIEVNLPFESEDYLIDWEISNTNNAGIINTLDYSEGQFSFPYIITDGICTAEEEFILNITQAYEPVIITSQNVCEGDQASATVLNSEQVLNWEFNGEMLSTTENEIEFQAYENTEITVTVENSTGCIGEAIASISILDDPVVEINNSSYSGCAPFSMELENIIGIQDNVYYVWTVNGESLTSNSLDLDISEGEVFNVSLTGFHENGCITEAENTITLTGLETPTALFEVGEKELSYLNPIAEFTNQSQDYTLLEWSVEEEIVEVNSELFEYRFSDSQGEVYEVCLEAISSSGCADVHCDFISINTDLTVYIPSAFTPNNDGVNEVFIPEIIGNLESDYQFQIFDRWGEIIFETLDPEVGWIGNVNNGDHYAQSGVYTYVVNVKSAFNAEVKSFRGHITLIR